MTEPVATTPNQLLAIDCHVHVHDWAQFVTQLDAALRSFTAAVASLRTGSAFHGILVLTEPAGRNTFAKLVSQLDGEGACAFNPGWTLTALPDSLALKASHIDGGHLFLISGQQIVTSENLEVLAIHAAGTIPDRLAIGSPIYPGPVRPDTNFARFRSAAPARSGGEDRQFWLPDYLPL